MDRTKKIALLVVGVVGAVGIGTAVWANAGDDQALSGDTYERAVEAALDHVGEGEVIETETGDDGAAYGVEIRKDDGSVVEVNLNQDFEVVGSEADEDGTEGEDDDGNDGAGDDD